MHLRRTLDPSEKPPPLHYAPPPPRFSNKLCRQKKKRKSSMEEDAKNNMNNTCKYLFYYNARAPPLCHAPQLKVLGKMGGWEEVGKWGNGDDSKHNKIRRKLFLQRSSTSEKFSARNWQIFCSLCLQGKCEAVEFSMFILKSCKNSKIKLCKKCE